MPERPRYSLEDDIDEAETAARDLPEQIARLRARVRQATFDLSGEDSSEAKGD